MNELMQHEKPRVLVRDTTAEEADIDRTIWVDADQEPEAILQAIARWLDESPTPDANWWEVIDLDGFPPQCSLVDRSDLSEVSYVAKMWKQYGEGFWVYYRENRFNKKAPTFESSKVHFLGCYGDVSNFFLECYEEHLNEEESEQSSEGFAEFCTFERDNYTILQWESNSYVYSVED
jgi:hypothetical protein